MSTLPTGPTTRTERPRYGGGGVSVTGGTAIEVPLSRCGDSVGPSADTSHVRSQGHLGAALVLLLGAAGHGDGAHHAPALHDGQRTGSRHDAAMARHHQALKPCLPG